MSDVTVVLSAAESARLANCESVIARGLQVFNQVGAALMRIRDERLYRARYATFEEYCTQQWGLSGSRAYQLVDAASVSELISSTTVEEINNEAQARELAPLLDDPDELREVWAEANERTGGKPTAAAIRQVRREREEPTDSPSSRDLIESFEPSAVATTGSDGDTTPEAALGGSRLPESAGGGNPGDAATGIRPPVGDEVSRPAGPPFDGPGTDPRLEEQRRQYEELMAAKEQSASTTVHPDHRADVEEIRRWASSATRLSLGCEALLTEAVGVNLADLAAAARRDDGRVLAAVIRAHDFLTQVRSTLENARALEAVA